MPYSGPNDGKLPDYIKELGSDDRAQWVEIFNDTYDTCIEDGTEEECETEAFKKANGVVLSSFAFETNSIGGKIWKLSLCVTNLAWI